MLGMLAGDDDLMQWEELAPIIEGMCYAGADWSAAAIGPVEEDLTFACTDSSFIDRFGNGCDWYLTISFAELRCKADSYKNEDGLKGMDCCSTCW